MRTRSSAQVGGFTLRPHGRMGELVLPTHADRGARAHRRGARPRLGARALRARTIRCARWSRSSRGSPRRATTRSSARPRSSPRSGPRPRPRTTSSAATPTPRHPQPPPALRPRAALLGLERLAHPRAPRPRRRAAGGAGGARPDALLPPHDRPERVVLRHRADERPGAAGRPRRSPLRFLHAGLAQPGGLDRGRSRPRACHAARSLRASSTPRWTAPCSTGSTSSGAPRAGARLSRVLASGAVSPAPPYTKQKPQEQWLAETYELP